MVATPRRAGQQERYENVFMCTVRLCAQFLGEFAVYLHVFMHISA